MLSRIVAASIRRGSRRVPAVSPALLGDVLPPLQWDRIFSSGTAEGGEQGTLPPSWRAWKQRKGDDGSVGQQQRCEGKRGRRKQIRALQQDDRSGSEQAEQKDGSDAEAIERLALLCGEEYDEDGDGYEENDVVDHGRERERLEG